MKGFTNVQPIDITAGPSTDVTGFNISGGPSKPIRAVDNVNIKTTGDLKMLLCKRLCIKIKELIC